MNAASKIEAPPNVNAAVAAIMAEIKPLPKGDRNSHSNYNFAGIDAFLDLTRPLCAKHKLDIYQQEESCDIVDTVGPKGPAKALLMRFAFTLECGDDSKGPFCRTIMVPANMGSQAFGAAQSYALKQFLRSLFQISTGEKDDIDHHDTGELAAPVKQAVNLVADADLTEIITLCEAVGSNQAGRICKAYNIEALPELTASQAAAVKTKLREKLDERAKAEAEKETADA